ncbi:MAG: tRNA (adenosine(37)-N6)-threonylcarbamoyltransferase complex ATPase subunit type 1 TsaE [Planctomycetaceae bacterium]|jgi:tRNA threonylcarbamoyladenosine biosynthesis protein TsaE|nr:tRNA (adenosine(37)-N6)-threonylcarbamoyltransferase complex ATPase subunit type 1 TsaE [Planctomycetaceae bacterium]
MTSIVFIAKSLSDTEKIGAKLAETLPDGSVVALIGTLGAGKTRLVQTVAEASGVLKNTVSSPTFVLIHEYDEGDRPIYHFDAYRLERESEFQTLGADEYFDGLGLSFVEWADKIPRALPDEHVTIEIEILSPESRRFTIFAIGEKYAEFIDAMTNFVNSTVILQIK